MAPDAGELALGDKYTEAIPTTDEPSMIPTAATAMATPNVSSAMQPSLIDDLLPTSEFSATYEIVVDAPAPVVYDCLLHTDLSDIWLLRLLMAIRTGKRLLRNRTPGDLRQRFKGTGFVILGEVPNQELVIGVAGRFWRPDGGRCTDLTAEDFVGFGRHGYAKAAWNFKLLGSPRSTTLSTETRIKCFGKTATLKFGAYWSVIAMFSGLIRRAILKQVKRKAEATVRVA
jgi:hypothetical protein